MSRLESIKEVVFSDATAVKMLNSVKTAITRYAETVFTMEQRLRSARYRLEGQELIDMAMRLDQNRHIAHESLIDSVKIANRYLFRTYGTDTIPAGGVYDADPLHLKYNNRDAIGEWALQMAKCAS
jgi:hypothetical protein